MTHFEIAPIHVDAQRARAYVLAHGGLREQARLASILEGARPPKEVVKDLEELQNPDGGFPLLQQTGAPSSVDTTCFILAQLKDMPPLSGSPMASRATAYLRRVQQPDGSWQEDAALADSLPPWTSPDNPQAAVYLTANAMFTSATLTPSHTDPVRRAERWITARLADAEAPVQALALAAATLFKLNGEIQFALLERTFTTADAGQAAWVLSAYLETGVGGRAVLPVVRMLSGLATQQGDDGAWSGDVETTLQALRVLRGYGVI